MSHNHLTREIRTEGSGCPACDAYHRSRREGPVATPLPDRKTFAQLQHEQGVTGLFDVAELHDTESPEEELEAYDAALKRLAEPRTSPPGEAAGPG